MDLLKAQVELKIVPLSDIEEGERGRKDYGNLNELVLSLKKNGLIQPLAVKALQDSSEEEGREAKRTYLLLAGGRRYRAASEAGLESVPVRIYPNNINKVEEKSIELAENIHREDLSYAEEVALCKEINDNQIALYGKKMSTAKDAPGWSQADTAELIGRSPASVTADIQLAEAISLMPQLADMKNKTEARKALSVMQEQFIRAELATRLTTATAESGEGKLKAKLCESYIVGDFFTGVKELPDGVFDLCEVDPPYAVDLPNMRKLEGSRESMEGYNEIKAEDYMPFLDHTLKESWRLLKEGGWLVLWFGPEPWFEPIYRLLKMHHFECMRLPGLWVKQNPRSQSMAPHLYMANAYEMFFYARKHNSQIARQGRVNTFIYPQVPQHSTSHPTERPIEMVQDILETLVLPGSNIVVPFLGSGNTLFSAANAGMTAVGFDKTKSYKDSFVIRAHEGTYGKYTSYQED